MIAGEGGKRYDRFRDRVMFPIHDASGHVVGFGGRVLDQGEPKYLNSPETPLFAKGRELYGLFQARPAIRAAGKVIVVEGYMDVVALAQHGVDYAVATLGTATTPVHAQKLLRLTDTVVFCFDGDDAGRQAAWRALENTLPVLADGKQVRFLFLPDGEDPDDARARARQGRVRGARANRPCRCRTSCSRELHGARRRRRPRAGPRLSPPPSRCWQRSAHRSWRRFSGARLAGDRGPARGELAALLPGRAGEQRPTASRRGRPGPRRRCSATLIKCVLARAGSRAQDRPPAAGRGRPGRLEHSAALVDFCASSSGPLTNRRC